MTPLHAFFLVGPTASGKSAVAQWIADHGPYAILSADSMLVYRGMDIGTAKPSEAERARVPYGAVDVVDPGATFSVGAYRVLAREFLRTARLPVIVAGGSGLYIKSLTHGLADTPPPDPARRDHWSGILERDGVAGLQRALEARDPEQYRRLADPANPRRLMRALEILDSGALPAERAWPAVGPAVPLVGLDPDPDLLRLRIRQRVEHMYRDGLVDECRDLRGRYRTFSVTSARAVGYAEAMACLDGRCTREQAMALTEKRTWQLVKRQRTWFRHQAQVSWIRVEAGMGVPDIASSVLARWKELGPVPIA